MAELLDSGARRDFGTGAVRDVAEGKGRCDLLPLRCISQWQRDSVFNCVESYIRDGGTIWLFSAIDHFIKKHEWDFSTAMLEVAKQYEDGARKYKDRNWENGIPVHVFIDSGVRHYLKFLRGDKDEPHDRAFVWNMLGAIWTHENKPELIDLPFANVDNQHNKTVSVVTNVNDDDMGEEDVGESEPVKGKYEGLSNEELIMEVCHGRACDYCVLCKTNNGYNVECYQLKKKHPEKFRKIAIAYLEGLEGKA